MPPTDETRLAPTAEPPVPRAEPAGESRLLAAIRAKYGVGPLSDMLYNAEISHRQTLVAKAQRLQARIAELQAQSAQLEAQGREALTPLEQAMERARQAWEQATQAYDRQRIANQSATVPVNEQIAEATQELNRSGFENRVRQWAVPDWYQPAPEVPRLGVGPTHLALKGVTMDPTAPHIPRT